VRRRPTWTVDLHLHNKMGRLLSFYLTTSHDQLAAPCLACWREYIMLMLSKYCYRARYWNLNFWEPRTLTFLNSFWKYKCQVWQWTVQWKINPCVHAAWGVYAAKTFRCAYKPSGSTCTAGRVPRVIIGFNVSAKVIRQNKFLQWASAVIAILLGFGARQQGICLFI
jgi:hypothetical protein